MLANHRSSEPMGFCTKPSSADGNTQAAEYDPHFSYRSNPLYAIDLKRFSRTPRRTKASPCVEKRGQTALSTAGTAPGISALRLGAEYSVPFSIRGFDQ